MNEYPFFFSWSKQDSPEHFEVSSIDDNHFFTKAHGKILDLSSISYQASFGHQNKVIIANIKKQLDSMPIASAKAVFPLKTQVSAKLIEKIGLAGKIFYTVSGAESIENAFKMLRSYTGKNIVVARERSYHGATLGALAATGDWRNKACTTPDNWILRIPEPDTDPLAKKARQIIEAYGPEKIAAFCLETVTGGNGVVIAPKSWWQGIQKICDDFKILLILDEVICGLYRTGKTFGFHHYPFLKPSFICMAKGISGGLTPLGALWADNKIAAYFEKNILVCGLTNYAYPTGLAALAAVLGIIEDKTFHKNLEENIKLLGKFKTSFEKCSKVKEVRHIGSLMAIECNSKQSWSHYIEKGIYLNCHENSIIIAPALTMSNKLLEAGLNKLLKIIKEYL